MWNYSKNEDFWVHWRTSYDRKRMSRGWKKRRNDKKKDESGEISKGEEVEWRGRRLEIRTNGQMAEEREEKIKGEAERIAKRKEEMKIWKRSGGDWTVMERKNRKDWGRKESLNRNKREQQKSEKESSKENLAEDGGGRGRPPRSVSPSRSSKCGWKPSVQSTSPVHDSYTPEKTQNTSTSIYAVCTCQPE